MHNIKVQRDKNKFFIPTKQKNYRVVRSILRQIKSLLIVFFMMHPHGQSQIFMILTMYLRLKILKEP